MLRGTGHRLGLLTNGRQFRLIYAGLDFESWCEWESDRWFDDGEGSEELAGLRLLLSPDSLKPARDNVSGLLDAVEQSRKKQADLSSVLRENVRQAVELVLEEASSASRTNGKLFSSLVQPPSPPKDGRSDGSGDGAEGVEPLSDTEAHEALLQATVRVVMRLVVCLFAESRQLLPVNDPVYASSYGVRTLYEMLEETSKTEGSQILVTRDVHFGWTRLMALFRLIHGGSEHGQFPLRAYGGALFRPGKEDSSDPVVRALHILEHSVKVGDATVFYVLRKLLRGLLPVIRGRAKTFVEGPVDYTDLRTEFIGLIYEGLLDYKLKRTDEKIGPQVFLNLGREPVFPLSRLQEMLEKDKKGLKDLLTKLRKEKATGNQADDQEREEEEDDEGDEEDQEEGGEESVTPEVEFQPGGVTPADVPHGGGYLDAVEAAKRWAREAVVLAGWVGRQRAKEPDNEYQARVGVEADKLIKKDSSGNLMVRTVGDYYLVRAGNTRKGTGTFYTRPQLAVPTVHRTLEPLCYDKADDQPLIPKTPETILGLKVCDPACGSASFLTASLHYLTDALYRSLCHHRQLDEPDQAKRLTLPFGKIRTGQVDEELVPFSPDDPHRGQSFADRVKALLRRHVVERCVYGVDINPLAVEFARVSLWVETLDPELPFSFLDHKVKVGNSLVGCWLDRVMHYPLKAWEREGGDGDKGPRTQRIEDCLKGPKKGNRRSGDGIIKREMRDIIEAEFRGVRNLFSDKRTTKEQVISDARSEYERLHELPVQAPEERERYYREQIESSRTVQELKRAMGEWCAVWFWPAETQQALDLAPTPGNFHAELVDSDETRGTSSIIQKLTSELKFFHWELEFPDVFTPDRRGFDAVVGNPPWDIVKPNTKEFFSEFDPLFRTLGKRAVPKRQRELLASLPGLQNQWETYLASFKAQSNWVGGNADPFAVSLARGREGLGLEETWKRHRKPLQHFSDPDHPFTRQGGADINKYKLFLELASSLLTKGGRLGIIVPGGIYTDKENHLLRKMLTTGHRWEWLFSYENKARIFQIDTSLRFCMLIAQKGGKTESVSTAFMRNDLRDWENADQHRIPYSGAQIRLFSPVTEAMLEVLEQEHLDILTTLHQTPNVRLGSKGDDWGTEYATEFHMSSDSEEFTPRVEMESEGYRRGEMGVWSRGEDRAVAFYTGKMISQFDFAFQEWLEPPDEKAVWRELPWHVKGWNPQFLMPFDNCQHHWQGGVRLAFRDMAKAINERTMIAAVIPAWPCGNKVPYLYEEGTAPVQKVLSLCAVLNSYACDFVVRTRLTGINLNKFIVEEIPVPAPDRVPAIIALLAARLNLCHDVFAPVWLDLAREHPRLRSRPWRSWWAVGDRERIRLRSLLDAAIADVYGLDAGVTNASQLLRGQFAWIVRLDRTRRKGFWRVGRKRLPRQAPDEVRPPQLALAAYCRLKSEGLAAFIPDTTGGSWQLPEVALPYYEDAPKLSAEANSDTSWRECERIAERVRRLWIDLGFNVVPSQPEEKRKPSQGSLLDQLTGDDGGGV